MPYPELWAFVVGFAVTMYVLLDGFDIGVGILLLGVGDARERDVAMNTVYPVWDGNETWIVLTGVGLYGGFPEAYATLLPALYVPFVAMLLAIVFRGVSLEVRFNARGRAQLWWDRCFGVASAVIAAMQGVILGTVLGEGVPVAAYAYAGPPWGLPGPLAGLTAALLTVAYALYGASWLVLKTSGALQARVRRAARTLAPVTLVAALAWVGVPRLADDVPAPLATLQATVLLAVGAALLGALWWATGRDRGERAPFPLVMALLAAGAAAVATSQWPVLVPPSLTIYDAASGTNSQRVLLFGALGVIPVILTYTGFGYYVFRGKAEGGFRFTLTDEERERLRTPSDDRSRAPRRGRHVPAWGRVGGVLLGVLLFFLLVGPFGEVPALATLLAVAAAFAVFWARVVPATSPGEAPEYPGGGAADVRYADP